MYGCVIEGGRGVFSCVFLRFGETPIYKAAYYDHPSTLELLIAKNADVNVVRDK